MATLFIVIVGFLHILHVESAPQPITYRSAIYFQENTKEHNPRSLEENKVKIPNFSNRFPQLDDNTQNWGILINESIYDKNDDTDYNRPITITRPSMKQNQHDAKEKSEINHTTNARKLALDDTFTPKPTFIKLNGARTESKTKNEEDGKRSCDVARIKCCFNNLDLNMCSKARECIQSGNIANMCESTALHQTIERVLKFLS